MQLKTVLIQLIRSVPVSKTGFVHFKLLICIVFILSSSPFTVHEATKVAAVMMTISYNNGHGQ